MPDSILDRVQKDPLFTSLPPKQQRLFLGEVLDRDEDFRALPQPQQVQFRNEVYRRYLDTPATAPKPATTAALNVNRGMSRREMEERSMAQVSGVPASQMPYPNRQQPKPFVLKAADGTEARVTAKLGAGPTPVQKALRQGSEAFDTAMNTVSLPMRLIDATLGTAIAGSGLAGQQAQQRVGQQRPIDVPFWNAVAPGTMDALAERKDISAGLLRGLAGFLTPGNALPLGGLLGAGGRAGHALGRAFQAGAVKGGVQAAAEGVQAGDPSKIAEGALMAAAPFAVPAAVKKAGQAIDRAGNRIVGNIPMDLSGDRNLQMATGSKKPTVRVQGTGLNAQGEVPVPAPTEAAEVPNAQRLTPNPSETAPANPNFTPTHTIGDTPVKEAGRNRLGTPVYVDATGAKVTPTPKTLPVPIAPDAQNVKNFTQNPASAESAPSARTVKMTVDGADLSADLSPEQAKAWDASVSEYKRRRAQIQQDANIDPADKPARLKALGMQHAAEKRRISGLLTVREQAALSKKQALPVGTNPAPVTNISPEPVSASGASPVSNQAEVQPGTPPDAFARGQAQPGAPHAGTLPTKIADNVLYPNDADFNTLASTVGDANWNGVNIGAERARQMAQGLQQQADTLLRQNGGERTPEVDAALRVANHLEAASDGFVRDVSVSRRNQPAAQRTATRIEEQGHGAFRGYSDPEWEPIASSVEARPIGVKSARAWPSRGMIRRTGGCILRKP